jgi:pimeloyl-ACP methyl ester carboxylesterase
VGLSAITDLTAMSNTGAIGSVEARGLLEAGAPSAVGAVVEKTLLVHGEDDEIVPTSQSTRLSTEARVEVIPGMSHFPILDPAQGHWPLVVGQLGITAP